jgi:hypothetical protein
MRAASFQSNLIHQALSFLPSSLGPPSLEYSLLKRCYALRFTQLSKPIADRSDHPQVVAPQDILRRLRYIPATREWIGTLGQITFVLALPVGLILADTTRQFATVFTAFLLGAVAFVSLMRGHPVIHPNVADLFDAIRDERNVALIGEKIAADDGWTLSSRDSADLRIKTAKSANGRIERDEEDLADIKARLLASYSSWLGPFKRWNELT